MRFTVGQVYTFARVLFHGKGLHGPIYFPWKDELDGIEVVNLLCKEHHKVTDHYDPNGEKKYDGFIFVNPDNDAEIWYNQYPTAHYGQLDDSADRMVHRHFETSEIYQTTPDGKIVENEYGKSAVSNQENYLIFESQYWHPFSLATQQLGNIYRGINSPKTGLTTIQKELLQRHLDEFVAKVAKISGKKAVFRPLRLKLKDGTETVAEDYYVCELE